jgi:hypothetical protein
MNPKRFGSLATEGQEPGKVPLVDLLTRRIERLGYRVTLEPVPAASLWIFNMGHPDHCAAAHLRLAPELV